MKKFILKLFESPKTKTIRSCMENGYIKSIKNEESLKEVLKKEIQKQKSGESNHPTHLLHKNSQNGKITQITISKNSLGKLEASLKELH